MTTSPGVMEWANDAFDCPVIYVCWSHEFYHGQRIHPHEYEGGWPHVHVQLLVLRVPMSQTYLHSVVRYLDEYKITLWRAGLIDWARRTSTYSRRGLHRLCRAVFQLLRDRGCTCRWSSSSYRIR